MTRYQKSQIEDVARVLRAERDAGLNALGKNQGSDAIACAMIDFANLFAADNPPKCVAHRPGALFRNGPCITNCLFQGGFNRTAFLADCGLVVEPMSDEDGYRTHEHNKDFPECYGLEESK